MLIDYYTDEEVNKMFEEIEEINFYGDDELQLNVEQQQEMYIEELENEMLQREYDEIMEDRVRQYEEEEYMLFGL